MPTILCFSTVDWDYLWHRPQAVMSWFAEDGYQVLYVDTLGLRSPMPSDFPRILSRLRNRVKGSSGDLRKPETRVYVHSPLVLPFLNSRLGCRFNVHRLVPKLQKLLKQIGAEDPIIWVYLPTWTVQQCVERIPYRRLVYESIDALGSNPAGVSLDYATSEREILRRANLVITTSKSLYQEKKPHNPNTHWVPSGVAEGFFAEANAVPEVEAIRGPRIGFFGSIDHRVDLKLMKDLARAHQDWSFVLIGAVRCDIAELLAEVNVHFLGPKSHEELPSYLTGLDVLWMPYVVDEFTVHIYPAKIFECLALGKPVVATALPSLKGMGEMVRLTSGQEGFEKALGEAVRDDDMDLRRKRVEMARANSWEMRYREIRRYVQEMG